MRNPRAVNGPVASLVLRLTHSGGEARDEIMVIPPAGAGMADILRLRVGHRSVGAPVGVANLCRIAWHEDAGGWQLCNGSYTLMCTLNGKRVCSGAVVRVAAGDTLELGLLRFVLEHGAKEVPEAQQIQPDVSQYEDIEFASPGVFDLHEPHGRGSDDVPRVDALDDPFGVLNIAGARSRPAADTLEALLDERPRREVRTVLSAEPSLDAGPAGVLLDELHEEFVRVVQDPGQLAGRTPWAGLAILGAGDAPTLEALSRQAETYPLLRDILLPREGIDQIIEAFEPLARSGLLDAEPSQEVLGMFAPELAREAKIPLPSLTRRQHHELSPDSHVRIGSTGTGAGHEDNDPEGIP